MRSSRYWPWLELLDAVIAHRTPADLRDGADPDRSWVVVLAQCTWQRLAAIGTGGDFFVVQPAVVQRRPEPDGAAALG
ncbi:hypothetical protein D3C80_1347920 [compost metagenome]